MEEDEEALAEEEEALAEEEAEAVAAEEGEDDLVVTRDHLPRLLVCPLLFMLMRT